MYKIYCCLISILFFGIFFSGHDHDADASDTLKYVSNRVKIVRPENIVNTSESFAQDNVVKDSEKEINTSPAIQTVIDKPIDSADGFVPATDVAAEGLPGEKTEAEIREEVSALIGKKERFYSRKGRIDPFEPFLRKPEADVAIDEKSELTQRAPRTPLEKIDLSQLRLTAVLRAPTKTKALVQESSGKGYVINEGTYIGNKGGQVSKILKDRMLVEEKYLDVFGKISVREREMKLQQ